MHKQIVPSRTIVKEVYLPSFSGRSHRGWIEMEVVERCHFCATLPIVCYKSVSLHTVACPRCTFAFTWLSSYQDVYL